jgi:hypothetical protein
MVPPKPKLDYKPHHPVKIDIENKPNSPIYTLTCRYTGTFKEPSEASLPQTQLYKLPGNNLKKNLLSSIIIISLALPLCLFLKGYLYSSCEDEQDCNLIEDTRKKNKAEASVTWGWVSVIIWVIIMGINIYINYKSYRENKNEWKSELQQTTNQMLENADVILDDIAIPSQSEPGFTPNPLLHIQTRILPVAATYPKLDGKDLESQESQTTKPAQKATTYRTRLGR